MEILGTKRFIPKGFELGTTLSWPNQSMVVVIVMHRQTKANK